MTKTLLVIGEVAPSQYQKALGELQGSGAAPEVRRTTLGELLLGSLELIARYTNEDGRRVPEEDLESMLDNTSEDQLWDYAMRHIGNFGDIGAIVMDEPSWNMWGSPIVGPCYDVLRERDFGFRWVAFPGGRTEFIG